MAFPQPSNLTNPNTAPLPTPPPRPERNRRGLRADTTAPSYRSNVSTFHGQVTLLPPPNMVRVRQGRSSPCSTDLTSASSSRSVLEVVDEAASTTGSQQPTRRRKKRQQGGGGDGVDGREDIVLKPLQTASEAIRERYRRSEAAMRAPPPPTPPPAPSSSSTAHVRRARARVGMNLDRGASMRRRNVQEDVVAPAPSEEDSDVTPSLPPPSYIQSHLSPLVLGSRTSAGSSTSNPLDPSPPYPTSSNSLQRRPPTPTQVPSQPPPNSSPIPSSPPPSYLLPLVGEPPPAEEPRPLAQSPTTEVPHVVEPLSLSRRIWDEMVREGIGFEERIKRMRAWENAGESEEEEESSEEAVLEPAIRTTIPSLPTPSTPPRPISAPPTSSPPRRPTTERVPSLPSFSWTSEPPLSLDIPTLTIVPERSASPPPSLPSLPHRPLFSTHYDPLEHLLATSSSTPRITPSSSSGPTFLDASTSSPNLNLTPPTPIATRPASQPWSRRTSFEQRIRSPLSEETSSHFNQDVETRPSPSRSSSPGEAPPLPPRPPANPPPAILLRLSRRRRPPPPPPRPSSVQTIPEGIDTNDDSQTSLPPSSWDPSYPFSTRRSPTPPPSLPHPHALASVPPSRRPPAPPPPPFPPRPSLNGTSSLSSPHLQLPRRISAVSVSSSSISEYPSGLQTPTRPGSSTGAGRQSWNGTESDPRREGDAHEGGGGGEARPAWAARPLPPVPPSSNVVAREEETLESLRGESVGQEEATPELQPQPFEITDLDLLVSQLDQNANQFEAAQALETFLSSTVPPHLTPHELSLLPHHPIVELSRRTTKAGKTKIKLSWDDRRVDRCSFGCLSVFKAGEIAVGLVPGCGHLGHEECAKRWFEGSRSCPVCREEIGVLEGGGGEVGRLI
ncbi:hypothetical protein BDY24DRAFT_227460 [Mrakia frigida]|uniref:uncharacterized protein n=1 Tax=Mrakia frigida TaxID=29902 RepID=UPI003FCC1ABF